MAKMTAREVAEKQVRNAQNASGDYVKGVQKLTVNPMELAKKAKQKMMTKFQEAMQDGSYEAGLDSVSLDDIKNAVATKGAQRYAPGVMAALPKTVAFLEEFLPFIEQVQSEVNAMPSITLEDNIAKMTANVRALARFKRTRRRR